MTPKEFCVEYAKRWADQSVTYEATYTDEDGDNDPMGEDAAARIGVIEVPSPYDPKFVCIRSMNTVRFQGTIVMFWTSPDESRLFMNAIEPSEVPIDRCDELLGSSPDALAGAFEG